jgi:hypothetical protein
MTPNDTQTLPTFMQCLPVSSTALLYDFIDVGKQSQWALTGTTRAKILIYVLLTLCVRYITTAWPKSSVRGCITSLILCVLRYNQ